MRQGEPGDCLYMVIAGRLEVFGCRDDGTEVRIAETEPGESVGEMALLSNESRVASVRVLRDAELLRLTKAGLDRLIARHPGAMALFTRQLASRLSRSVRARSLVTQLRSVRLASPEERSQIAGIRKPILRNLKITQMYHRLSLEIALLLGYQDANWCTFACNTSKTAGYSIRGEEIPFYAVIRALRRRPGAVRVLDHLAGRMSTSAAGERVRAVLSAVSDAIAEGNLKVFAELAPVFAAFVAAVYQDKEYHRQKLEVFLERLRPGRTEAGGQQTLAEALAHYYDAAFEPDPKRKAELILLGNIKIGLHEQTRLQPQIIAALDAPVVVGLAHARGRGAGRLPIEGLRELLIDRLRVRATRAGHPAVPSLAVLWRRLVTRSMMTLRLPYGALRLGADLPGLPNARMHADMLDVLHHPELIRLVRRFDMDESTLEQSRASDWGELDERMNFIVNLFMSRQKSLELFDPPFLMEQCNELACNRVPQGEL